MTIDAIITMSIKKDCDINPQTNFTFWIKALHNISEKYPEMHIKSKEKFDSSRGIYDHIITIHEQRFKVKIRYIDKNLKGYRSSLNFDNDALEFTIGSPNFKYIQDIIEEFMEVLEAKEA